jgi:hypothetical protein
MIFNKKSGDSMKELGYQAGRLEKKVIFSMGTTFPD